MLDADEEEVWDDMHRANIYQQPGLVDRGMHIKLTTKEEMQAVEDWVWKEWGRRVGLFLMCGEAWRGVPFCNFGGRRGLGVCVMFGRGAGLFLRGVGRGVGFLFDTRASV